MNISAPAANRWLVGSASIVVSVIIFGFLAPWIAPYSVGGLEAKNLLQPPSTAHWLGTDGLGRDLLTRVLYGARVSMTVGIGTALIALVLGTSYGLVAGFKGGNWDDFMMRVVDIFYGLPPPVVRWPRLDVALFLGPPKPMPQCWWPEKIRD